VRKKRRKIRGKAMKIALTEREEFKLKAAEFLLEKLKEIHDREGHIRGELYFDVEVYVESFLFHIIGTLDAFLQYLNSIYNLGIKIKEVSLSKINEECKDKNIKIKAVKELNRLYGDINSWLWQLNNLRNHCGHRSVIPKHIKLELPSAKVSVHLLKDLLHPEEGPMEEDALTYLENCLENMRSLLKGLHSKIDKP